MLENINNEIDERILWEKFQEDDMQAFSMLVHKYAKHLYEFGYRFCCDKDIVLDCLQEIYADLWERRSKLPLPVSIKGYLFKIVRNRIIDVQAKNRTVILTENNYDFQLDFSIEDKLIIDAEDRGLAYKIKKTLNSLSPRKREIIYLRYYENLSFDQIAKIMNLNKQSVHNLLQKAYSSFRAEWSAFLLLLVINLR